MSDFALYCQNLTDSQVLAVLEKEDHARKRDENREVDFQDVRTEAIKRELIQ